MAIEGFEVCDVMLGVIVMCIDDSKVGGVV